MDSQRSLCGGRSSGAIKRIGVLALCAPCVLAAFAGGCGSDGGGSASLGPAGKFLGRWELDGTSSTFTINCPASMLAGAAALWGEMVFEKGVLTDATETSGNCLPPGLAFDVDKTGVILSVSNPDPYTGMAPVCSVPIGTDAGGHTVFLDMSFTALDFTLLQTTAKQAPKAMLSGTGTGAIAQDDGTGTGNYVQVDTCTYSGTGDVYHRMSQP
ncbi:MAG TPA: hypothetical protein VIF57_01870 [Polyangia bacterium]